MGLRDRDRNGPRAHPRELRQHARGRASGRSRCKRIEAASAGPSPPSANLAGEPRGAERAPLTPVGAREMMAAP
jgi:hypothetical protein